MESYYEFANGVVVSSNQIDSICETLFESIKKELPKEAQSYEVIMFVIKELTSKIKSKNIIL